MAKCKFDWSSINRYELTEYIWTLRPKVINKEMSIEKFHRLLGNHIKHTIPVKLKKWGDNKVDSNCVWVGGLYHSNLDKEKQKSIELEKTCRYSVVSLLLLHYKTHIHY